MMRAAKHSKKPHGAMLPHGSLLALGLIVVSCGGAGPTVVGPPVRPPPAPPAPPPPPTTIVMVSGDAVAGASPADTTYTDSAGRAQVYFQPTVLGRSTVSASARTPAAFLAGSPVTFSTEVTTLVIEIAGGGWWCWDPEFFSGPDSDCTGDVTVPVATTVEWVAVLGEGVWRATVTSTSEPAGGEAFDSGLLYRRQRFQFVPRVTGTWEYVDRFSGQTGTLTAR